MRWVIACSTLILLFGCASVEVTKITDENRAAADGIRFWRPAPYLAVFGEKDGGCSGKIIFLPDPKEEYVMREKAGFGSASLKPTLTDGWNLTAFDSTVDSKAADVLGAFAKAIPAPGVKSDGVQLKYTDISPGLYRIRMDSKSGALSLDPKGVYQVGPVCATLKSAPDAGGKGGDGKGSE